MITTNFNGDDYLLLDLAPNGQAEPIQTDIELIAHTEAGATQREARRAFAASMRWVCSFTITAKDAAARRLEGALRDYQTMPVALPLWPLMKTWATRSACAVVPGMKLVWKADWSQFELFTEDEPGWPAAGDYFAPVLVGDLQEREGEWRDTNVFEFVVDFVESSPIDFAIAPQTILFNAGPLPPSGYVAAPRLLPFRCTWDEHRQGVIVNIIDDQIGFRRESFRTLYPQTNASAKDQTYLLQPGDLANWFAFWSQHGAGVSFWSPSWTEATQLTSAIGGGVTVLPVTDTVAVKVGDWLACIDATGAIVATPRISSKTSNTITVAIAPGALPVNTLITRLQLVRFAQPKLSLTWLEPELASCKVSFREVPPEYVPAGDETIGTTLGALPTRGYLFDWTHTIGGTTVTTRQTSYERDLVLSGNTYTSFPIQHGDIKQSLNLQRDEIEITSAITGNSPLIEAAKLMLEVPLMLTVREVDVSGSVATNPVVIFAGEVVKVGPRGHKLVAKVGVGRNLLKQQFPNSSLGPQCRYDVYGPGCTLVKADWEFTAEVASPVSSAWPYELHLENLTRTLGAAPTYFADWFALGTIQFGSGANLQQRFIVGSTLPSSGALTLKLRKWFKTSPAIGATVTLYPGCDLRNVTCKAYHATDNPEGKFDNYINFGGEDQMPVGNPSLIKISNAAAGGKK